MPEVDRPAFPPDVHLRVIPLEERHLHQVVELLQAISEFKPSPEEVEVAWRIRRENDFIKSYVVEDSLGNAIAFGVLLLEQKLRGGVLGHIEDIVVREDFRGSGVGSGLVQHLLGIGRLHSCYKLVLSCSPQNEPFYKRLGFTGNACSLQLLIA
jgi:glucosamine-phosphate N-acetyltransferase